MSSKAERKPFKFTSGVRNSKKKEQRSRCLISGSKYNLQAHHILPISWVLKNNPDIDPSIIKQKENCVLLCGEVHSKIHQELCSYPEWFRKIYYDAMLEHLIESVED